MSTLAAKRRKANSTSITSKLQKADATAKPTKAATKQLTVIQLLQRNEGATIDRLVNTTGWQRHSVRGFLAGVLRKRLGLTLVSSVVDGQRIYRIGATHGKANRTSARRQA